ncbi:hypothetical protein N9023_01120 [Opitutaceae bacterium]|nr:hypothetical protein [Opitutaceae bacterium]MDB4473581.1 hypothetical protein [Opitutaceae bacterium]
MRLILTLLLTTFMMGCGTTPDSVEWRVKPQSNYYSREKATVFESLVGVLEQQGYQITRSAAAAGEIEAQSKLLESRVRGAARQYFVSVKMREIGEGETGVELLVHEAREGDFKVGVTKSALSDHGRYESINSALEAALGEDSWLPPRGPV